MSFIEEIKRRKVYHVAAAYLVVSWLLVQIVSTIEEPLRLPDWFDTAIIVLLAVGFPIALLLSWFFNITSHGVMRDRGPEGALGKRRSDGRRDSEAAVDEKSSDEQAGVDVKDGRTLAELISAAPVSVSRLLSIAVQIAESLATMHADDIVHGALTPFSIMIDANDRVRLREPGAAGRASSPDSSAYQSPEQQRGDEGDFRSDQYALGAVLYEMATGRRAITSGRNRVAAEAVTRLNPQVPMPLEWLIGRCLEQSPGKRFFSTRELSNELFAIAGSFGKALPTRAATPNNLPAQRTALIGRDDELANIWQLVRSADARLLTLTGAGGIGKTRLLVELGRLALDTFRGGVFFVPLDRINDPDLVASEIAKVVNVQQSSDSLTSEALLQFLRDHCTAPTLLLIDNLEHLMEAAPLLTDLLSGTQHLKIVATSRAALRVYGELEVHVLPLSMARDGSGNTEALANSPAVKLFLDRSTWMHKTSKDGGAVANEDLAMIAEICERLDGLPLAIELAAARSRVLSLPALLEHVRKPLQFLSGGPRDMPARQQTLRATLDWSYDLLAEDVQKLFRRLGVFVGGATLEAIEAVCNVRDDLGIAPIEGIENLVECNLLNPMEVAPSGTRFTILETMRDYALERLAESDDAAYMQRAHAAYFRVLSEESSLVGDEAHREALYEQFETELGNLRAALDWLTSTGNAEWGLRIACALGHYWQHRGYLQEAYERISKLLELDQKAGDTELRAVALAWRAEFALNSGNFDAAKRHYLESLIISRNLNIVPGILRGLNGMAVVASRTASFDEAIPYLEEALDVARDAGGSASLLGSVMTNVANFVLQQGNYERAQQLQEEAAALFQEAGDQLALAWSLNHQGDIARNRGDQATARRLYEESLARFRELNERLGIAGSLYDLAAITADAGDHAAAIGLNQEALAMYGAMGHKSDIPRVVDALAISAAASGDADRALRLAGSAAAMRKTYRLHAMETGETQLSHSLDRARQQMSGPAATASWLAGWSMRPEQAMAFALANESAALADSR